MKIKKWDMESETKTILTAHEEFTRAQRKTSFKAIEVGRALSKAKAIVKEKKEKWEDYIKSELSNIAPWEVRDFRALADQYDKEKLPGLLWINQTNLKKIFQACKNKSLKAVFEENGIELPSKEATNVEIKNFQHQILNLLKKMKANKNTRLKGTNSDDPQEASPQGLSPSKRRAHYIKELSFEIEE